MRHAQLHSAQGHAGVTAAIERAGIVQIFDLLLRHIKLIRLLQALMAQHSMSYTFYGGNRTWKKL
jgi:hypothetical protein